MSSYKLSDKVKNECQMITGMTYDQYENTIIVKYNNNREQFDQRSKSYVITRYTYLKAFCLLDKMIKLVLPDTEDLLLTMISNMYPMLKTQCNLIVQYYEIYKKNIDLLIDVGVNICNKLFKENPSKCLEVDWFLSKNENHLKIHETYYGHTILMLSAINNIKREILKIQAKIGTGMETTFNEMLNRVDIVLNDVTYIKEYARYAKINIEGVVQQEVHLRYNSI